MKKKLPELELAIDGFITPEQAGKLKVIRKHFENLESRKAELEKLILALASPYQQELDLILTAPSLKDIFTAIGIISEIGVNMEAFPSAKHQCSWAGLTPTNNESAGKKKSVRVSKAGCYIKPLLVQCANSVVKSKKHPEIRNRYLRLKKRRGHKKAIIAIARMLLTALYHMLKNKKPYNAELYRKSDFLPVNREMTFAVRYKLRIIVVFKSTILSGTHMVHLLHNSNCDMHHRNTIFLQNSPCTYHILKTEVFEKKYIRFPRHQKTYYYIYSRKESYYFSEYQGILQSLHSHLYLLYILRRYKGNTNL
jgi:hypothetical protein